MADTPFSDDESNGSDPPVSLFELVSEEKSKSSAPTRVRELKRMLFDLAYLVMNADGTEHVSEQMLVRELEARMEREGSVDVEARTEELKSVLNEGPDAIRLRVAKLADDVADRAGDRTQEIGARYLDLLRGLIVADANVDPAEYQLFEVLCERWEVENNLPM
jgi:uncharacterized tellurite resistance protein B-like protein